MIILFKEINLKLQCSEQENTRNQHIEEEPNKTFRYKAIIETKTSINNSKSGFDTAEKIVNTKKKKARMLYRETMRWKQKNIDKEARKRK